MINNCILVAIENNLIESANDLKKFLYFFLIHKKWSGFTNTYTRNGVRK